MEKAHKGMEATIEKLEGGEAMDLCGFCTSYGMLMAEGAESTELKTVGGDISLLTSDDPEVVKKIHAHAEKTIEEFKKMMAHGHQLLAVLVLDADAPDVTLVNDLLDLAHEVLAPDLVLLRACFRADVVGHLALGSVCSG